MIAEVGPHLPVPIRKRAVAESIKQTEKSPGKGGETDSHKVGESRLLPGPAEKDEQDQDGMKDEKKFIQNSIHLEYCQALITLISDLNLFILRSFPKKLERFDRSLLLMISYFYHFDGQAKGLFQNLALELMISLTLRSDPVARFCKSSFSFIMIQSRENISRSAKMHIIKMAFFTLVWVND